MTFIDVSYNKLWKLLFMSAQQDEAWQNGRAKSRHNLKNGAWRDHFNGVAPVYKDGLPGIPADEENASRYFFMSGCSRS